jgi:hypothetical protein
VSLARAAAILMMVGLVACSGRDRSRSNDDLGVAVVAITNAPADAACLQITVAGSRTVTQSFDLTPGQSTIFTLTGLPVGSVVFSEVAFAVACASVGPGSVPTWISDPVPTTIVPGVVAHVTIVLHRSGQAVVTTDFSDDDGGTGGTAGTGGTGGTGGAAGSGGTGGTGGGGMMCTFFFDDSTLPLLQPGGVRPPLP